MFMQKITVSTTCGKYGSPINVKVSILVVSRLTRLMRLAGLSGEGRGRTPVTTCKPMGPGLRPELVDREFKAPGSGKLLVVGITYVRTRKGFV